MPSTPFLCPKCGKELPLADLNVSADMALCRACGYSGPFLKAASVPHITDEEMAHPPKRVTLRRGFDDELEIVCRPKKGLAIFLIPFTAIWSGGSMAGIYGTQLMKGEFDLAQSLFGIPFLLGTIVLVTIILHTLFGKTIVTLSRGRVQVFSGLFGMGRFRTIACGKGTRVSLETSSVKQNNVSQSEIVLRSGEKTLKFGAITMTKEIQRYVAAVLRRAASGG